MSGAPHTLCLTPDPFNQMNGLCLGDLENLSNEGTSAASDMPLHASQTPNNRCSRQMLLCQGSQGSRGSEEVRQTSNMPVHWFANAKDRYAGKVLLSQQGPPKPAAMRRYDQPVVHTPPISQPLKEDNRPKILIWPGGGGDQ